MSGLPYSPSEAKYLVAFNLGQSTPNGVVSQALTTEPGKSYTLTFDAGVLAYNWDEQRLQVTAKGANTVLSRTLSLYGKGDGSVRWSSQSLTFVADSWTTTLAFRDVSPTTHSLDLLLDNVRLTLTPTASAPQSSAFSNGGFESGLQAGPSPDTRVSFRPLYLAKEGASCWRSMP